MSSKKEKVKKMLSPETKLKLRIKHYLIKNNDREYIDCHDLAKSLHDKFPEYTLFKFRVFKNAVEESFESILEAFSKESESPKKEMPKETFATSPKPNDKNNCAKCVEKDDKIQDLEIEYDYVRVQLVTEVQSKKRKLDGEVADRKSLEESNTKYRKDWVMVKKALEESKAESKMELEKLKNQLQISKSSLEKSMIEYRKIKQFLATKIFQANPSNEDLDNLMNLEPEKLFEKHEQITRFGSNSDKIKLEETTKTLQDVKNKLKFLTAQKGTYEKQLIEIREVLHLPAENGNFANILPYLKNLLEENETNHCSIG